MHMLEYLNHVFVHKIMQYHRYIFKHVENSVGVCIRHLAETLAQTCV